MDRFGRGLVAGVVGGIAMNAWGFISKYVLHFTTLSFTDWAGIMVYGYLPHNIKETLYALIQHLVWVGALGVYITFEKDH